MHLLHTGIAGWSSRYGPLLAAPCLAGKQASDVRYRIVANVPLLHPSVTYTPPRRTY